MFMTMDVIIIIVMIVESVETGMNNTLEQPIVQHDIIISLISSFRQTLVSIW